MDGCVWYNAIDCRVEEESLRMLRDVSLVRGVRYLCYGDSKVATAFNPPPSTPAP